MGYPYLHHASWPGRTKPDFARTSLYSLLALTAHDVDVRAELATLAAARIGYPNGSPDPLAIEPEFVETALSVAVQEFGRPFFEELFGISATTSDIALRQAAINAFRSVSIPSLGQSFCSDEQADDLLRFVQSNSDRLPGYEHSLAQTQEQIALCAVLRESVADELYSAISEAAH